MNEFIIMRLSNSTDSNGNPCDGAQTMQAYKDDHDKRGNTWFSTSALHTGMAKDKVRKFNNAIKSGKKVTILFAIGKLSGGTNEIVYKANVLEVYSERQPVECPTNDYPDIFKGEKQTIWLNIENIQEESELKANMFKFTESGKDLQDVIVGKNQFAFGYVTYK